MQKLNTSLVLTIEDYNLLTSYLNGMWGKAAFDHQNAEELKAELKKAKIVDKDEFPSDVVRLNSRVKIKADGKKELMELTLVTPEKANIKEKKVSIFAPIGAALLGFRQGRKIKWHVPAGKKTFTILEVTNPIE